MNLDVKEKKLLYWLDQNSRATNKKLGKKVGLTEQAIGYKLKRLQEEGIIKKFITFVNTPSLGYYHYKVFIRLQNTTAETEKKIIRSLISNKNIRWVVSLMGRYDLSFSVLARNPLDFSNIYNKIESRFGEYIAEKNILINVKSPGFTRDYLIEGKTSRKLEYKVSDKEEKADYIDKKILKTISQDSRKNITDISREVKETVDIVKYRLKKLKEKNIISSFTIQLGLEKINYEYYTTFFHMHNLTNEVENKIINFAISHPNILFVVRTIGNHDLQFEIEVKNYYELEEIIKNFRQTFSENIMDFEILRVTKEYKYDFYPF